MLLQLLCTLPLGVPSLVATGCVVSCAVLAKLQGDLCQFPEAEQIEHLQCGTLRIKLHPEA